MAFIYTRSDLKSRINAGIQNRIGMLVDADAMVNDLVRDVFLRTDMRSAKRRANLTPNLVTGIFPYNCPSDLKGDKVIDIPAQAKRQDGSFTLVTPNEFRLHNGTRKGEIAVEDFNGQRTLYIASGVNSLMLTVAELDSLSSGATADWALFGDATNVARDDADYVMGNGSIKFNISAAAGTTAGIQNSNVNTVDLTDYLGGTSSFFLYAKIASVTGLNSYTLRFGTNSSNYYSKTVTAQHDGTAFVAGFNLLRFDISSLTETGSVTDSTLNYFVMYMNKETTKVSESDYKFDWLVLAKGEIHYVHYYSNYGWQSSAGAYKQNSTDDGDLLVANENEYALIVKMGQAAAAAEVDLPESEVKAKESRAMEAYNKYVLDNPSEAMLQSTSYYDY